MKIEERQTTCSGDWTQFKDNILLLRGRCEERPWEPEELEKGKLGSGIRKFRVQ